VLPKDVTVRLAVEAGSPRGWERYVGTEENIIGIDRFGASAPGKVVMEKYGFTAEKIMANLKLSMK
jgi:transketolase